MTKIGAGHFVQILVMLMDLILWLMYGLIIYHLGFLGVFLVCVSLYTNRGYNLVAWRKKNIRRTFNHHWPNASPQENLETLLEKLWKGK